MSANPNHRSVLVVDDDEVIANVLSRLLEREGYSVVRATSPARALALAGETAPDVALLDLCYPDGDGVELANELHARDARLPLILMTAYPVRLRERPELSRLFNRVLHKPINLDELRRAVRSALDGEVVSEPSPAVNPGDEPPAREGAMEPSTNPRPGEPVRPSGNLRADDADPADAPARGFRLSAGSLAYAALFLAAFVGFAAFALRVPMPWQGRASAETAGPAKAPPAAGLIAAVELVPGAPHTLALPEEARKSLGILQGGSDLVATAVAPTHSREMVLPGSTALDPTRLYRVRARFAPARVVEIARVLDLTAAGDRSEMRELRSGDHVKKGDLLGVFYSADVGQKKNDLVDALYQLNLDEQILSRAMQKQEAVPEIFLLNAKRNVEGDRNAIARALSNLRTWDVPEADIQAVHKEAEEIAKRGGQRDRSKDDLWPRVELRAPADGVIVERNVVRDEMVVDQTVNLFQIATTDRLFVTANAPEDDLPALLALTTDQRRWTVRTVGQLGKEGVQGRIDDISYVIDPNQHTAVVKGHIENPVDRDNPAGRIRAGQFVTATIRLPPPADVVEVPVDAVIDDGQQCVVFVETDAAKHQYSMRRVEVTQHFEKTVLVRSKPFAKEEQPGPEEQALGLLPKEPLRPGERILQTGVNELKAALLDKESEPEKAREETK